VTDFVYLMAASHSGSTLLTLLLASHPDVATVGETCAVQWTGNGDTGLCSCGFGLEVCPFWRRLGERLGRRGIAWNPRHFRTDFQVSRGRLTRRVLRAEYQGPLLEGLRDACLMVSPVWRRERADLFRNNQALIEETMRIQSGKVFLDSSKEPHRLKFFLQMPGLRIKVIHMIRDGRGVMNSYLTRSRWTPERSADEWRRSIVSEEHILHRLQPEQYIQIRYEDLCREMTNHVGRVLTFMGLNPDLWDPNFNEHERHILGNRMRMRKDIEVRLNEQWRESLTPDHLTTFEGIAGHLNRKYGYE